MREFPIVSVLCPERGRCAGFIVCGSVAATERASTDTEVTRMVTRDTPRPDGTPSWVDLGTNDIPKAMAFYSRQFGWEIEPGGPEMGGYTMARLGGRKG